MLFHFRSVCTIQFTGTQATRQVPASTMCALKLRSRFLEIDHQESIEGRLKELTSPALYQGSGNSTSPIASQDRSFGQ